MVNVAVIGMGSLGLDSARRLDKIKYAKLVAVSEVNRTRIKEFKKYIKVPVFTDYRKMLDVPDIDLVIIATPNFLHASCAIAAMEAGKAVFLQKPMATSIEDCKRIIAAYKKKKPFLQVGFECRYSFAYRRIKEAIEKEMLGKIKFMHINYFPGLWSVWLKHKGGWKYKESKSGGMVGEKLSHYLDLFRWFSDSDIAEVYTISPGKIIPYFEIMDNLSISCRMKSGAVANLVFSFTRAPASGGVPIPKRFWGKGDQFDLSVIGTKGSIYCDIKKKEIIYLKHYDNGNKFLPAIWKVEDHKRRDILNFCHDNETELKDIIHRVHQGREPFIDPLDSYKTMLACFAAEESAKSHKIIKVGCDTIEL